MTPTKAKNTHMNTCIASPESSESSRFLSLSPIARVVYQYSP